MLNKIVPDVLRLRGYWEKRKDNVTLSNGFVAFNIRRNPELRSPGNFVE